ncbi:energy transducer TonB [Novosphingobium sp.]|uniref:energy transducer TonB n=1 Tax=Novosphingobium sp. TaxID=1874826 RepID=UPI00263809FE|nr:energy transducer TonB [Novosphingobium sp.]
MAYGTTAQTNRRRIVALGAVGAVHGVMAVALLTGFAGGIITIREKNWLPSWNYMPPPPPPRPEPTVQPKTPAQKTLTRPAPLPTPLPLPGPDTTIELGPLPTGGSDYGNETLLPPLPPLPRPSPSPSFTARAAQPLGVPGKWVSDADYPAAALRRGDQGATRFELAISPDGRVRDCRIAQSSGSADLDAATCARLTQRARFTPARDEHGDLVAGRYSGVIRWRIPE